MACVRKEVLIDTAPEAMREYKGWVGVADRLRSSLRASAH